MWLVAKYRMKAIKITLQLEGNMFSFSKYNASILEL